jgi:hypothetical protein
MSRKVNNEKQQNMRDLRNTTKYTKTHSVGISEEEKEEEKMNNLNK